MIKRMLISACLAASCISIASCSLHSQPRKHFTQVNMRRSPWEGNPRVVWSDIQQLSTKRLLTLKKHSENNPEKAAWIELALIAKFKSRDTQALSRELLAWREQHPDHPGNAIIPSSKTLNNLLFQRQPQKIAVLLPKYGDYSSAAEAVRAGILNAYYNKDGQSEGQRVKFYDISRQDIKSAYKQAMKDGADFIIGPLTKSEVQELKSGVTLKTPTLALNYAPRSYFRSPRNLFEFGLKPEDEAKQVATRARSKGLSRALVIAGNDSLDKRLTTAFLNNWENLGGKVTDTLYYENNTDFTQAIPKLLKVNVAVDKSLMRKETNKYVLSGLRRHDFDVIFVFAKSDKAHTIVPMLRYYYTGDTPIFATSSIYGGNPNASRNVDLNGVIVCDIPKKLRGYRSNEGMPNKRLFAVGKDAYILSQNLDRLNKLPNFPIYGATGALMLSGYNQIHRRIPCTPIKNQV